VEIAQFAKKLAFDKTAIWKKIPRTLESCFYYVLSTILVFYYIYTPNAQVARLLRNLTAKSSEVACFLYLYYSSLKEMQEQVVTSATKVGTENPSVSKSVPTKASAEE
jgi:hypothetical protein